VKPTPQGLDLFSACATFDEFKDLSEKLFLQHKLQENEWNVKRTAEALGMQRSHLYKKIERYGLK
jgi:transcriptional regulator of acetoin/glycerol metabolism